MENNEVTRTDFLKATAAAITIGSAERTVGTPAILSSTQHGRQSCTDMVQQFLQPPRQARPWAFWVWLHANTSCAILTRDLEEMKAKCTLGCILYDCGAGCWPRFLGHGQSTSTQNGEAQLRGCSNLLSIGRTVLNRVLSVILARKSTTRNSTCRLT